MNKIQNIKEQFASDLKKIEDAINFSSLSNLRIDVWKAVSAAKENAEKHLNALEEANDKADQIIDPWIEKARSSRFTPLYVAFLFLTGLAVGVGVGIHL